jgi:glycosyltransferase involved in cell wall biosynthesis
MRGCAGGGRPDGAVGVVQLIDTLDLGGAERMAVTVANALPASLLRSHLIATRRGGPLERLRAPHVAWSCLHRRWRLDVGALRRLIAYLRRQAIEIVHAHGTALFVALLASAFAPRPKVVWHDHYGRHRVRPRSAVLLRRGARRIDAVIAVSDELAAWSRQELGIPADRVWSIPNFVHGAGTAPAARRALPGTVGSRIVCVANARPEKNHRGLLEAMRQVVREVPAAHLLLVGPAPGPAATDLQGVAARLGLSGHVTVLDREDDVRTVLQGCDVGVLGSLSEGCPLAILEYGSMGLPAVATDVGACADILESGRAGIVVPAGSSRALADALLRLLRRPGERERLGARLRERVRRRYGPEAVIPRICDVYDLVLGRGRLPRWRPA